MRMPWMALVGWTAVTCLIAGGYGALHNQISYTVSPDYFHAFKFVQFQIPDAWYNRWGAAVVGWCAAWWVGLLLAPPLVIVVTRCYGGRTPRGVMARALAIVVATTLIVGLGALAVAFLVFPENPQVELWSPLPVSDRQAFLRAGIMHDASYAGGLVGLVIACLNVRRPHGRSQKTVDMAGRSG